MSLPLRSRKCSLAIASEWRYIGSEHDDTGYGAQCSPSRTIATTKSRFQVVGRAGSLQSAPDWNVQRFQQQYDEPMRPARPRMLHSIYDVVEK